MLRIYSLINVNKYGYVDINGKWIVKPVFDSVGNFFGGFASVESNGKWGYIDESGKLVIKPEFDLAYSFSGNGLAIVKSKGKFGTINTKGDFVLKPLFKGIEFFGKLMKVKFGNVEGYAMLDGKYLTFTENEVKTANLSSNKVR